MLKLFNVIPQIKLLYEKCFANTLFAGRFYVAIVNKKSFSAIASGPSKLGPSASNKNPAAVGCGIDLGAGGERGIRTPGGVTLNSFQDCRNRPLCHLSGRKIRV
jgi:hypothetical protein